ncbi:PAS domain S-box protein [Desulfopila sp. IMCC35006]|uniref:cache domain-containing protein n=1 Tax=Desulfopila sp. IMCC35006 TaxID=2569542 RepID=UPI0010AD9F94|nr:cache domain-containing protein [Desulfopila sp. IMCC35006]TKB25218.1 PAS domain S-box protein [Desulfopila sp. IMCC35006]
MFAGTRIRHKLLFYYSLLFTLSLSIGFATVYVITRDTIEKNIESELHNTSTTIYNLVTTSLTVSIKNYLRSAAEKNLQIIESLYLDYQNGLLTEQEAKERARRVLLSQTIGESGYIYCLNSSGIVVVHPQKTLLQTDVSEYSFVRDLLVKERGYLEYDWKNPDEKKSRPKALYMIHFKPWDWFISVSSYREEFKGLVNVDDFRQSVLDVKFGKTGYAFVMNNEGKAIIHPKLEGVNILTVEGLPNEYLASILEQKNGRVVYSWRNPGETEPRSKLCYFSYIEDYDWIVGAASYQEEFYGPLRTIRTLVVVTFIITMLLVLTLTFKISDSITSPLRNLMEKFTSASKGDFSLRMAVSSKDELGQLAMFFNRFMEQLGDYSSNLKQQIQVRQEAENSLRESEERYRSVMEAAADPIVIYDMEGRVTYFNPAFRTVFGWRLEECLGKKLDHFVPRENWPETELMITAIRQGTVLPATETKRYTKTGEIRNVSISGAAFRDHLHQLAGSVVILRDITETKRLTRQLMDIGDNVRQTIGQDLHDDLCPHLIGIGGLVSALKTTIKKNNGDGERLAEKIVELIGEATSKARGLARGLCPVHLVAYGLQSALNEIADKTQLATNIHCSFSGDPSLKIHDNTLATHLYYIVQEAVNNAVKHSGASSIDISLEQKDEYIHLWIIDDGRGIDDKQQGKGIGLQIMKYRVLVIGAFLEITSQSESGTIIHVFMKKSESMHP